jgi:hypothetical protein
MIIRNAGARKLFGKYKRGRAGNGDGVGFTGFQCFQSGPRRADPNDFGDFDQPREGQVLHAVPSRRNSHAWFIEIIEAAISRTRRKEKR